MNANDYQNDPLAKGDPCNQISARCDLASNGFAFGGIDSKNVDHTMVNNQVLLWMVGCVWGGVYCWFTVYKTRSSLRMVFLLAADHTRHLRTVARERSRL